MRRPALALVALTAFVGGCSAYQITKPDALPIEALAAPPAGKGQICVLRPHWIAGLVLMTVRDNGELVGATRGVTYFCYYAEPGHHHITSHADSTDVAEIDVAVGQSYYLHQIVDNIAGWVRARLAWVTPDLAREMVEKCGYRVLTSVPAKDKLPDSPPIAAASHPSGS